MLNVVDDFSRESDGQLVDTSISGAGLARFRSELDCTLPKTIVCDNEPGLTCKAMFIWSQQYAVKGEINIGPKHNLLHDMLSNNGGNTTTSLHKITYQIFSRRLCLHVRPRNNVFLDESLVQV